MRPLATLFLIAGLAAPQQACARAGEGEAWRPVYADAAWYRERDEPERVWRGTLRPLPPTGSPAGRAALRYELVGAERTRLPVYDPAEHAALRAAAGGSVEIRAKLIDLEDEGFGRELWPGSIGIQ